MIYLYFKRNLIYDKFYLIIFMKQYTKLSQIEHVLKRPGMYIGSI